MVSFILTRYSRPTPTSRSFLVTYPREWENHVDDTPPKFNSSRMKNESWKTFKHFCTKGGPYFSKFFLYLTNPTLLLIYMQKDFGVFLSGVFIVSFLPWGFQNNFLGQVEQLSFKMFLSQCLVGLWRCRIKFFSKPCVTAKLPVPSRIKSVVSKNQKWLEDLEPFVNRFMSFTPIDSTENVPGSIASELHQLPPVDDQTDLSLSILQGYPPEFSLTSLRMILVAY